MTTQFNAYWRWTDSSGVEHTAPFLFEDPDGDFLEHVERHIAPHWRRDFPSNYAAWAAEASRSAPKPIPYLNLPEPPIPEINVLWYPYVASQYAHIAAIFDNRLPLGQKVELVTNIAIERYWSLFFGYDHRQNTGQYVTTLYVASRRSANGYSFEGPFICVLVDWRYFARSVPFEIVQKQEGDAYFFDQVVAILEKYNYLSADVLYNIKKYGICSDVNKALAEFPLDRSVFAEGASLPLLIDAALYCRGAYLYHGFGVDSEYAQSRKPTSRYPTQVCFPTVDVSGTSVPKPKYFFPDYWTSVDEQGETVDPTPAVNADKSLSLTGYVDIPAILDEASTAPDFIPSNVEQLKTIAGYIGRAVNELSSLTSSSTFYLGNYVGPNEYTYIPNSEFFVEQYSISGLNTCINFPLFNAASKPWDFKRCQILVDKTKLGPFRYQYSAIPVEYVDSDFYTGWRFVGPFMDAENTIEASNSVLGVQGNGVSLGFEPVPSGDSNGVEETRIVLVTSGVYEVYYAADAPVPIGCGAVVDWNFDGSRFLFSAVNASQGWSGAAYGTLYADFTQNETRDALATVTLVGEDKALRSVIEAAGGYLNTARYMCYSPFSKPGDTMASGTRVCVIRNAALKRFEIIQAECD